MTTRAEELAKGSRAEAFLGDPTFQDAITKVRAGIIDKFENSPVRDHDGQHECRLMLKVLNDILANIKEVIDTGKLASAQVEEQQTMAQKALRIFRR